MSIEERLASLNSNFMPGAENCIIILAAGHGKRIKSERSKMLHEIWGLSTVERVYRAAASGLPGANTVIVVGVKAEDVASAVGKRPATRFAFQREQRGTGDAVRVGLSAADTDGMKYCYVLPGDMGLVNADALRDFQKAFTASGNDMMVLTGMYDGPAALNHYGRIVRTKERTADGKATRFPGAVIEIKEYKDITALSADYRVTFKGESFTYTKDELLAAREFNAGVYVFRMEHLAEHINELSSDNAQKELYITDLIALFNRHGRTVGAASPKDSSVVLGFNNKSVLKEMDGIARNRVYERLKDIVTISDEDDFFTADDVIDAIIALDGKGIPLDIVIGKGVHLGAGVTVNYGLTLKKNVFVEGNVVFGRNVTVWANAHLSCYPEQTLTIGDNAEILWGDIIKGNISVGANTRIESSVNITGSDEYPTRIGSNVTIKGTSYLFGSIIDDDVFIEHSVIARRTVRAIRTPSGEIKKVRYVLPEPEGLDAISRAAPVVKK
ncbi:MAG: NTP transferase domain-containing protein [Spirochaetota bacterium]